MVRVSKRRPEEFWSALERVASRRGDEHGNSRLAALTWVSWVVEREVGELPSHARTTVLDVVRRAAVESEGGVFVARALGRIVQSMVKVGKTPGWGETIGKEILGVARSGARRGMSNRAMVLGTVSLVADLEEVVPLSSLPEFCALFLEAMSQDPGVVSSFAEFLDVVVREREVELAVLCPAPGSLIRVASGCLSHLFESESDDDAARASNATDKLVQCLAPLGLSGLCEMWASVLRVARNDSLSTKRRADALGFLVAIASRNKTEEGVREKFEEVVTEYLRLLELCAERIDYDTCPSERSATSITGEPQSADIRQTCRYSKDAVDPLEPIIRRVVDHGLEAARWQTRAASLYSLWNWDLVPSRESWETLVALSQDVHPGVRLAFVSCLASASASAMSGVWPVTVARAMLPLLQDSKARVRAEAADLLGLVLSSLHRVDVRDGMVDCHHGEDLIHTIFVHIGVGLQDQRNVHVDVIHQYLLESVSILCEWASQVYRLRFEDLYVVRQIATDLATPNDLRDQALQLLFEFLPVVQDIGRAQALKEIAGDVVTVATRALEDGRFSLRLLQSLHELESSLETGLAPYTRRLLPCIVHFAADLNGAKCPVRAVGDLTELLLVRCGQDIDLRLVPQCVMALTVLQRAEAPSDETHFAMLCVSKILASPCLVGLRYCDPLCAWAESTVQGHEEEKEESETESLSPNDWCQLGLAMRVVGFIASSPVFPKERRATVFGQLASCVDLLASPLLAFLPEHADYYVFPKYRNDLLVLPGHSIFAPFFNAMRNVVRCGEEIWDDEKVVAAFSCVIRKLLSFSDSAARRDGFLLLSDFARSEGVDSSVVLEFFPTTVTRVTSDDEYEVQSALFCLVCSIPHVDSGLVFPYLPQLIPRLWQVISNTPNRARGDSNCATVSGDISVILLGTFIVGSPEAFVIEEDLPRWLDLLPSTDCRQGPVWFKYLSVALEMWPDFVAGDDQRRSHLYEIIRGSLDRISVGESDYGAGDLLRDLVGRLHQFAMARKSTGHVQPTACQEDQ